MLVAVMPGDGIGPEVTSEAMRVLTATVGDSLGFETALVGGAAYKAEGHPLPPSALALARRADAILFGSVGDPECDDLERHLRPEQAILGLRAELGLFANLRPAKPFPELADASTLRPEVTRSIDLLIVRELNGDVYFGDKGMRRSAAGLREGYDEMRYDEAEVARIAHVGFRTARGRRRKLCSIDKANVLATILSGAMMLRHSFDMTAEAERIEAAVAKALAAGARSADLGGSLGTRAMGDAVLAAL